MDIPERDTQRAQARVALLPAPQLATLYANAFHADTTADALLLTICVSQMESDAEGPVLAVRPQARLGMTLESARRLAQALLRALHERDQAEPSATQK